MRSQSSGPIPQTRPNSTSSLGTSRASETVGIVEPLRRALDRELKRIHAAFVYGSVAKGTDTAASDIDLLVVSDSAP